MERGRREEAVQIHVINIGYLRCGACQGLGSDPASVLLPKLGFSGSNSFKISISRQFQKFE